MTNYNYFCKMMVKATSFEDEDSFYDAYKECFPEEQLAADIFQVAKDGIKALRKMTIDSQAAFAERMGVPVRTLQKWETGEREPAPYTVNMMAYIFLNQRKEDKTMKRWVIVDYADGDMFEELLPPMNKKEAIEAAVDQWEALSAYDRKRRYEFYVGCAEVDEDGIVDFDTMTDTVDVIKLHKEELEAEEDEDDED